MKPDEQKIKEGLLGTVKRPLITGNNTADTGIVKKRLTEDKDAKAVSFCRGCGKYANLNAEGAQQMALLAGSEKTDFKDMYFETENCIFCTDDFTRVTIQNL